MTQDKRRKETSILAFEFAIVFSLVSVGLTLFFLLTCLIEPNMVCMWAAIGCTILAAISFGVSLLYNRDKQDETLSQNCKQQQEVANGGEVPKSIMRVISNQE